MRKGHGFLWLIISFVVPLLGCVGPREEVTFMLDSWEVVDDEKIAALLLRFNSTKTNRLYLLSPDGAELDSEVVEENINETKLRLAGYMETPRGGIYSLIVKNEFGEVTFIKNFTLKFNFSIAYATPYWEIYNWSDYGYFTAIRVKVENKGDLPAYLYEMEVSLDNRTASFISPIPVVLPGEEIFLDISRGTFNIRIKWGKGTFLEWLLGIIQTKL
jgi:hypothetical protein